MLSIDKDIKEALYCCDISFIFSSCCHLHPNALINSVSIVSSIALQQCLKIYCSFRPYYIGKKNGNLNSFAFAKPLPLNFIVLNYCLGHGRGGFGFNCSSFRLLLYLPKRKEKGQQRSGYLLGRRWSGDLHYAMQPLLHTLCA